jgi:FixJ family two-component response regulator
MADLRSHHPDGRKGPKTPAALVGIVDDDESVRESISSLLRSVGYRSAEFESAEAFLGSHHKSETDCLVLVLDVRMPGGLSGLELQRRLSDENRSIPIIFITGHGDDKVRARALAQGALAFLSKPFDDEALLGAIQSALDHSQHKQA